MDQSYLSKQMRGRRKPPSVQFILREVEVLKLNRTERRKFIELAGLSPDLVEAEENVTE